MSCAPWQSGYDIHDFCCCHLWCWWSLLGKYCIRSIIIFHNIASEYNSTFVFMVLCLQFGILQMTDIHQWKTWTFSPFVLASSITSFLLLTFVKFHAGIFSSFSHSLSTAALCCGNLHGLRHRNKFVYQIIMLQWNCHPFLQYGPHDDSVKILPYAVLWIYWLPKYTQVLIWVHWFCHGSHHVFLSCLPCKA